MCLELFFTKSICLIRIVNWTKSNQYYTAVLLDQYQPQLLTYMTHQYHTIIIMIIMIIMIVTIIMITCIGLFSLICVSAFNALQSSLSIR